MELKLGKESGLSIGLGSGGIDIGWDNIKNSIQGYNHTVKNTQIVYTAHKSGMDNAATALRMRNKVMMDVLNDKSLFTTDLVADIYNYEKSRAADGEASDFEKYVLENYDTNADYWRVVKDSTEKIIDIKDATKTYYPLNYYK